MQKQRCNNRLVFSLHQKLSEIWLYPASEQGRTTAQVGKSVKKKRANKVKALEKLVDGTITFSGSPRHAQSDSDLQRGAQQAEQPSPEANAPLSNRKKAEKAKDDKLQLKTDDSGHAVKKVRSISSTKTCSEEQVDEGHV